MNTETFDDLRKKFSNLEKEGSELYKKQMEEEYRDHTDSLFKQEDIMILSDDELDMLKAYRQQVAKKASGLFRWRYSTENKIVTPETPSLIVDPRNETE